MSIWTLLDRPKADRRPDMAAEVARLNRVLDSIHSEISMAYVAKLNLCLLHADPTTQEATHSHAEAAGLNEALAIVKRHMYTP